MSYLTKEERAEYERGRRKVNMQESRNYRLIQGWLVKQYPDIMAEHEAFRIKLARENPMRKDLTTSPAFRRFMREEKGMKYVLLFVFPRYCVTVNWL